LRQAILDADADGAGTITFNIPTSDPGHNSDTGVWTIRPDTPLPDIVAAVTINGYSQTGAGVNTLAIGDDATLVIDLDGSNVTGGSPHFGLHLTAGSDGSTI